VLDPDQGVYESGRWAIDLSRRELRVRGTPVPIGSRAFDVLEALVRSAGEVVSKDHLMRQVWPSAIVEDNTLQVHISALRKALGPDRGLLKTAPRRGYRLLGTWSRQEGDATSAGANNGLPPPSEPFRSHLPHAGSNLIGRTAALQDLRDRISAYRVVTLTGLGGIGKTRLALEVARSLMPSFKGDIAFVEFVALTDPRLVPSAVAGALSLTLREGEISASSVARAIGQRPLLLVLDNCEHVIGAAAELAGQIVRHCHRTSILATSREFLRVDGEYVYLTPPLEVPPQHVQEPEVLREHSAVQLFLARLEAMSAQAPPHDADFLTIGAICRRLDGLPLAIELAAASAATLGTEIVLSRLEDCFTLLTQGRRTVLPRHRTLRATLDWSYELLPEPERRLLHLLGIFPTGFTLEAAVAVVSDAETKVSAIVEGINNLVAKSLLVKEHSISPSRWRLLETTRAYALEKLAESGVAEHAHRRHAEFFRDLVTSGTSEVKPEPTPERIVRLARELDHVRAALLWAFSTTGDAVIGVTLTAAYVPVWLHLSLVGECRGWVERALSSLQQEWSPSSRLRMELTIALEFAVHYTMSPSQSGETVLTQALEIAEALDDTESQLRALWVLFARRFISGDSQVALRLAERFSRVTHRTGDPADILVGDRLIGSAMHYAGNQLEARRYLQRVLDLYVPPSSHRHTAWFLHDQRPLTRLMLARVLWLQGFLDQARHQAALSLDEAQATDHKLVVCYALANTVCRIALETGDFVQSESSLAMLKDLVKDNSGTYWSRWALGLEGECLIRQGELAQGIRLLRRALDARKPGEWMLHYPEHLGTLAQALAGIGDVAAATAIVDETLTQGDRDGNRWYVAEHLRIKGEVTLLAGGSQSLSEAEDCFSRGLTIAAEQGALFWELRIALSLAHLRIRHDRHQDAKDILRPVYGRFTEGFETAELRAARGMLEPLDTGC
jgi:predicted ATPase/DNA-binding winged helix-turn-helix (wHTH) protein